MKASELRIGNYVYATNVGIPTDWISQIEGESISRFEQGYVTYNPIPLTSEWLERFGFTTNDFGLVYDHPKPAVPEDEHKDLGTRYPSFFFNKRPEVNKWMDCHTRVTVQYVHQLQNLYFALTGTELTIKDDGKKEGKEQQESARAESQEKDSLE